MTKTNQIKYINKIYLKFQDARNHGHNGNSWWYPKPNVIAYNVKMHGGYCSIEELRKKMTKRQNEYYSDEDLYREHDQMVEDEARHLMDEIKDAGAVESWFAGRSGGWLEVEYSNPLSEVDEDTDKEDLKNYYKEAKTLEKLEATIGNLISTRHSALIKYIGTENYYSDLLLNMYDDETIGEIYKDKAHAILNKLK